MDEIPKVRSQKIMPHKMPPAGTVLVHKTRPRSGKGVILYAKVVQMSPESGIGIFYSGQIYKTMSAAARAAGGYMVDGWLYWKQEKKD